MLLQYKDALSDCDQALLLDRTNSKAYFRKATALKGLGMLNEALAALDCGLSCDPGSAAAKQEKRQLEEAQSSIIRLEDMVKAKRFTTALSQIDKLISTIGSNFRVLSLLRAECLLGLNRPEEAYNLTNAMVKYNCVSSVYMLKSVD
jgi:tetratricopeptide (TPR) repeat protein